MQRKKVQSIRVQVTNIIYMMHVAILFHDDVWI